MKGDAAISWLMFFTLSAGVVVGAALLLSFLRSRHNREIAAYALEGDGRSQRGEPSGAAVELLALSRCRCNRDGLVDGWLYLARRYESNSGQFFGCQQ
jgi:hypothetical protein